MHDSAQPLRRRRVFDSRNPDQTRAFMAGKEFGLELKPRDAKAFDFVANAAYLPGSYLGFIQYGAAATIRVPDVRARDDYWLHLAVQGACEITNNAGSTVCVGDQAVLSSPVGHMTRSEAGSSRLTFSMTRATVIDQLATLLGDVPNRPLVFAPTMDLKSAAGQRFLRYLRFALVDLEEGDEVLRSPLLLGMHEQVLLTGLLLSQPNSYSETLQRPRGHVDPANLKRAVDFIQAHLHRSVTLADITAAAGVPGRTLHQHFKDHRGVSPMRYLHDARFARAREELLRAQTDESVTQIAAKWGFRHLGRFAVSYRDRFGETPSQTRRRGRAR